MVTYEYFIHTYVILLFKATKICIPRNSGHDVTNTFNLKAIWVSKSLSRFSNNPSHILSSCENFDIIKMYWTTTLRFSSTIWDLKRFWECTLHIECFMQKLWRSQLSSINQTSCNKFQFKTIYLCNPHFNLQLPSLHCNPLLLMNNSFGLKPLWLKWQALNIFGCIYVHWCQHF